MKAEFVVACATACPLIALAFCYIYPILVDFKHINKTHCNVYNFLPSVSATISYNPLTSLFWFILILIHTPFRFILAKYLHEFYKNQFSHKISEDYVPFVNKTDYLRLSSVRRRAFYAYQINKIEIIGLFILSMFTSNSNYGLIIDFFWFFFLIFFKDMHKLGFCTYLISATFFKILVLSIESKLKMEKLVNFIFQNFKF